MRAPILDSVVRETHSSDHFAWSDNDGLDLDINFKSLLEGSVVPIGEFLCIFVHKVGSYMIVLDYFPTRRFFLAFFPDGSERREHILDL